MIDAETWIVALFAGAIFLMALVSIQPPDSRGAKVWRRIGQWIGPLVLAWLVAKELVSLIRS